LNTSLDLVRKLKLKPRDGLIFRSFLKAKQSQIKTKVLSRGKRFTMSSSDNYKSQIMKDLAQGNREMMPETTVKSTKILTILLRELRRISANNYSGVP
jgi:hypothetical protein